MPEPNDSNDELKAVESSTSLPPPVHRDLKGVTLHHYRVHDVVGVGGMGTVYRGVDVRSSREVAVKVLDPLHDPAKSPISRERFQREARLSMRLSHANIVEVLDAGEHDGVSFIVMELLTGQTLAQVLERDHVLSMPRALALFREMCSGLSFAHELGLVHRDLKPANVMVLRTARGEEAVKLLDFGLAKPFLASGSSDDEVTRNNLVMGSPTYMAPEQARGESGIEGDIYSLGVVLFRMLTGRVPFTGRSGIDVIVQHVQSPVPHFSEVAPDCRVSEALELVVRRCLEKQPQHRYPSVKVLLEALAQAETAAPTPMPKRKSKPQLELVSIGAAQTRDVPVVAAQPLFGSQQSAPRSFAWVWVMLALVSVGAGAWFLGRSSAAPEPVIAVPSPSPVAQVQPPPDPAPASVSHDPVTFRINSIPIGATVKWSGQVMGLTPVVFEVPVDENGEATAELTLELKGYQALTFIATSSGPRFDLVQRLRKGSGRVTLAAVRPEPLAQREAEVVVPAAVPPPVMTQPGLNPPAAPVAIAAAEATTTAAVLAPVTPPPAVVATPKSGVVPLDQVSVRPRMINPGQPPRYTREALAAKVEGTSVARCRVTLSGALTDCHITKSLPMLDDAVMQSLRTRRYEPAKVGSTPVETEISVVTRLLAR